MSKKELQGKFTLRFYFPRLNSKNIMIEMKDNVPSLLTVTRRSRRDAFFIAFCSVSYYHQETVMNTCAPKNKKRCYLLG